MLRNVRGYERARLDRSGVRGRTDMGRRIREGRACQVSVRFGPFHARGGTRPAMPEVASSPREQDDLGSIITVLIQCCFPLPFRFGLSVHRRCPTGLRSSSHTTMLVGQKTSWATGVNGATETEWQRQEREPPLGTVSVLLGNSFRVIVGPGL